MKFSQCELAGAYLIELEKIADERGFFARTWCRQEFEAHGLVASVAQANTSFNTRAGTLRGMHYQAAPYEETKLVRCTRGAIYDVIVDIRPESATFTRWMAVELSAESASMLYIPSGFAHGFITLADNTEVAYLMSEPYQPGSGRGLRWDDPQLGIEWPRPVAVISDQDAGWPDFTVAV